MSIRPMYSLSMKKKAERGVPIETLIVKARCLKRRKRENRKARRNEQRANEEADERLLNGEMTIEETCSSRFRKLWNGGGKGRSEVKPERDRSWTESPVHRRASQEESVELRRAVKGALILALSTML